MKITPTAIADVLTIEPEVFEDSRGLFYESFNQRVFNKATGLSVSFVQDNHSRSLKGVLRGLHYQTQRPQGKLVRVVCGAVFAVAVDLRKASATFSQWVGLELSADNRKQLWVPPQFAHGFIVLNECTDLQYKTTSYYNPTAERCIRWNDADLGVDWQLKKFGDQFTPHLSARDQIGASFRTAVYL